MRHAFKPDGTKREKAAKSKRASGGGAARAYWCAACTTRVADEAFLKGVRRVEVVQ